MSNDVEAAATRLQVWSDWDGMSVLPLTRVASDARTVLAEMHRLQARCARLEAMCDAKATAFADAAMKATGGRGPDDLPPNLGAAHD